MKYQELYDLYITKKLPIKDIASIFKCDRANILYYVKKYGIPQRNKSRTKRSIGEKIGDWTLISYKIKERKGFWVCKCDCGVVSEINVASLNIGKSKSCKTCAMKKTRDNRIVPSNYWLKVNLGAKRRNIGLFITHKDIENILTNQKYCCALTGWKIDFGKGRKKDGSWSEGETTASLDRIDSNKDYSLDNIQWVHKDIQNMKQSFKEDRLFELCEAILSHRK